MKTRSRLAWVVKTKAVARRIAAEAETVILFFEIGFSGVQDDFFRREASQAFPTLSWALMNGLTFQLR